MSINADIHKYGYSPKGSSVLVYRNSKIRRNQFFTFSTWPGGIYISSTALGSKNGGCISSAWGSLLDLGEEGFMKQTEEILKCVEKICNFINEHADLELLADPHSTIISFKCKDLNTYKFCDALKARGYFVEVQSNPDSIHLSIMPQHCRIVDELISKMKEAIEEIKWNENLYESGTKAVYGSMAKIPDEEIV